MLDLWECNKERLADLQYIYFLLDELPGKIGMNKIAPPQIVSYPPNSNTFDKGGISAFVLIAESHISLHSFIEQAHVFVDIFSCKEFNIQKAIGLFVEAFGVKKVEKKILNRGAEFPKEIPLVTHIIQEERKELVK